MKILNRIQADRGGRVVKILVADGEMVEFGQELMVLEPFEAGPAG
jgi:acetyl-CoA carboxylase biotin carboxyl carrier protein